MASRSPGATIVTAKTALKSGSSQHGKARRQSVACIWLVAMVCSTPSSSLKRERYQPRSLSFSVPAKAIDSRAPVPAGSGSGQGEADPLVLVVVGPGQRRGRAVDRSAWPARAPGRRRCRPAPRPARPPRARCRPCPGTWRRAGRAPGRCRSARGVRRVGGGGGSSTWRSSVAAAAGTTSGTSLPRRASRSGRSRIGSEPRSGGRRRRPATTSSASATRWSTSSPTTTTGSSRSTPW